MKNCVGSRLFEHRVAVLMIVVFVAVFCSPVAALAEDMADLPWNTALDNLVKALSGKTAGLISMVGIFFAGGMLIFGGDLGNFGKTIMMVVLVGSMMGALATIVNTFISTSCLIL